MVLDLFLFEQGEPGPEGPPGDDGAPGKSIMGPMVGGFGQKMENKET